MGKPSKHILVCSSSRINGQQSGFCHTKGAAELMEGFYAEIMDRNVSDEVIVTNTGCLAICKQGPIVIVYPDNVWYGSVTEDDIEEIMDEHIEGGKPVERLLVYK